MRLFRDDLAELPLFSEASRSELAVIRRQLTPLFVSAGATLVREGARGDEFMVLAEGNATVSHGGQTIATLERGDLVGEMALLEADGARRRNATVTVSTDAVVYVGSRSEFRQILQAAPSVARKVLATAAARSDARAA
ncbi:MAG TPA: cyclic nucleotide-binding domain-containing protein [Acidimicrobiales bacterium]|jgi:cAMP-dependent protein kinase regulator|nr:cyclic nucleotide-binding domain-containing protein [Acidimicrobiales bacterium]